MKIDHDLRQAIKAAHKHQAPLSESQKQKIRAEAVATWFNARPSLKKQVYSLLKKAKAHYDAYNTADDQIRKLLENTGLQRSMDEPKIYLDHYRQDRFTRAGGDVSKIEHSEWQVDEVIAELAAADPKDAAKILAKYGIRWD